MRYVALGSSMAAGPGISPRAPGSPRRALRSARNYPHLLAAELDAQLVDVTYSGATTANVLDVPQYGAPPQVEALDGSEELVTLTIGGNDVGFVPMLMAAWFPGPVSLLFGSVFDEEQRERAFAELPERLDGVLAAIRERSPRARVLVVDYLTVLPPTGRAGRVGAAHTDLGRSICTRLDAALAEAAPRNGAELVAVSRASRDHHPWSRDPWTVGGGPVLPWKPFPFHPNAAGMRATAEIIKRHVRG